jgi:hypothetical protein
MITIREVLAFHMWGHPLNLFASLEMNSLQESSPFALLSIAPFRSTSEHATFRSWFDLNILSMSELNHLYQTLYTLYLIGRRSPLYPCEYRPSFVVKIAPIFRRRLPLYSAEDRPTFSWGSPLCRGEDCRLNLFFRKRSSSFSSFCEAPALIGTVASFPISSVITRLSYLSKIPPSCHYINMIFAYKIPLKI